MGQQDMPPSIVAGFAQSRLWESGGIFVKGVDKDEFINFITHNWQRMIENLDSLPVSNGSFLDDSGPRNHSILIFEAACEWLPPQEYVDFLEKWVTLFEKKKIPYQAVENAVTGITAKNYFVAVNWEDARIKSVLRRIIAATPDDDKVAKTMYRECLSGRLADNYLVNRNDDAPPPETLPGIKLKAPFENQLARVKEWASRNGADNHGRARDSRTQNDGQHPESKFGRALLVALIIVGGIVCLGLFKLLKPRMLFPGKKA